MTDSLARWQGWLDGLHAGDSAARGELLAATSERLTRLTRRMLKDYPRVRRWEQTDDVLQNALLRLLRALDQVRPATLREYFRLAALQIRRELLDLARHYYGPQGAGAHHASHADADDPERPAGLAPDVSNSTHDPARLASWSEFHQQVEALPADTREVFELIWYQALSQVEAAKVLGVNERTVQRHWQAARLELHAALQGL
ncbi:MAG: RNA polymerase sigma factor [Gemmataceae bacterium]